MYVNSVFPLIEKFGVANWYKECTRILVMDITKADTSVLTNAS